ncbi:MAG: hypothetical protein PHX47_04550 [Candidatus ainarchaeum sp.]|nr:hypothetical protein [Candidatus ainarchaeum sp.]
MIGDSSTYFEIEHSYLVTTMAQSISELDYFLNNTILRDNLSLKTFSCGVNTTKLGRYIN